MQKWGFSAIFSRLVHQIDLKLHAMKEPSSLYNLTDTTTHAAHNQRCIISIIMPRKRKGVLTNNVVAIYSYCSKYSEVLRWRSTFHAVSCEMNGVHGVVVLVFPGELRSMQMSSDTIRTNTVHLLSSKTFDTPIVHRHATHRQVKTTWMT